MSVCTCMPNFLGVQRLRAEYIQLLSEKDIYRVLVIFWDVTHFVFSSASTPYLVWSDFNKIVVCVLFIYLLIFKMVKCH